MKRAAWLLLLLSIAAPAQILDTRSLETWVEKFNRANGEATINAIDNASAAAWMRDNVPNLDCPDKELEEIYYFRWWTYRKHIRKTPSGYVVTEFLPDVPWAGKYDTISCAAGHHLYEGRWIRDKRYLDDYSKFWFRGGGAPRLYSFWAADAVYARFLASGDFTLAANLLPDLIANYRAWEVSNLDSSGLFWQIDDRDGMEISIGGSGYRPTINSYMFGDAMAIAQIAALAGKEGVADEFRAKARRIRALVDERLWNDGDRFYEVLPRGKKSGLANVRELIGYVPWYFHLPGPERSDAGNSSSTCRLLCSVRSYDGRAPASAFPVCEPA